MRILLDGEPTELRYNRTDHLGWQFYYIMRNGQPWGEVSVPGGSLDAARFKFRTGGC